ncbi:MAG: hypothetical protein C4320_02410 [Armatimonadota bacterium]
MRRRGTRGWEQAHPRRGSQGARPNRRRVPRPVLVLNLQRFQVEVTDGPFDFGLCVRTGQVFRWKEVAPGQFVGVDGADAYWVEGPPGVDPFAGGRGTGMNHDPQRDAHARPGGDRERVTTRLTVTSTADAMRFRRFLRLDADEEETHREIVRRDPRLAPYLLSTRGLRLLRPAGRVETIFSFICSGNNNVPRITTMVAALGRLGEPLGNLGGELVWAFPTIERLAAVEEGDLRSQAFGYRATSIVQTSRTIADRGGEAFLDSLAELSFTHLVAELGTWRGVGPKIAQCIALFAYDRTEAVPMDTHLIQMLARLGYLNGPERPEPIRMAAEHFRERMGPYAARAQQALFYDNLLNWRSRRTEATVQKPIIKL